MAANIDDLRALLVEAGVKPELARSIDPAKPLLAQGLDSLDFPSFCALLEERSGLVLDEENTFKLRSLDDFARFLGSAK